MKLNENGEIVEAALRKSGFTLRDSRLSIRDLINLGLVDATPPLTGDELRGKINEQQPPNNRRSQHRYR